MCAKVYAVVCALDMCDVHECVCVCECVWEGALNELC